MQSHYEQQLSSSEITLRSYELGFQGYILNTTATLAKFKNWIDETLTLLPSNARIIEIGSGFGRDAKYIESCGFTIERTDAAVSFVTLLQNQGYAAYQFNILTDAFNAKYDLIFANSVFLHFTPQELERIFAKIYASMTDQGILAFSVKKGEGEEWTTEDLDQPRYYYLWTADTLCQKLQLAGFEVINISINEEKIQVIALPHRILGVSVGQEQGTPDNFP
jgi:predicted TPR repeat methyltransferase